MKPFKSSGMIMLLILMLLVSACGEAATAVPPAPTSTTAPAAAPTDTTAAAAAPTDTTAAAAAPTDTTVAAAAPTDTVAAGAPTVAPPTPTAVVLGSASAKTTITIWHGWSGSYLPPKQAIFAAVCAKQHPDVAINLLNVRISARRSVTPFLPGSARTLLPG